MLREAGVSGISFAQQVEESAANLGSGSMDSTKGLLLNTQLAHARSTAYRRPTHTLEQDDGPVAGHHSSICSYTSSPFSKKALDQCFPITLLQ